MSKITVEDQNKIVQAINLAENKTSGEIRLVVEKRLGNTEDSYSKSLQYFEKLNMHNTTLRNGVLIYIALEDKALAIIGDKGINEKVGEEFWHSAKEIMISKFKENKITDGLIEGIQHIGDKLKQYFPNKSDDVNELPNDIYFGNS